jgi:hypothetical protein
MLAQELESRLTWGEASLNPAVEWREYATRETQWLRYQRLQGYLQGIAIEGAEALRVLKPDGSMALLVEPILPDQPAGSHNLASTPDPVWLVVGMQWLPAERRESYRESPLKRMRTWFDQNGRPIDSLDLIRRWDTTIAAKVFLPDPLSVANVPYGGQYVDANDGNAAVLDQHQSLVGLKLTWNGSGFVLANSAAVVQEFDPPTVAVPILPGPTAFFSRSDAEFEMVNALYHIYQWKQRMANLGYPTMVSYPIPIDVNAYNGADLSAFDFGTNPPRLYFGEGGVDDAEDAAGLQHGNSVLERRTPLRHHRQRVGQIHTIRRPWRPVMCSVGLNDANPRFMRPAFARLFQQRGTKINQFNGFKLCQPRAEMPGVVAGAGAEFDNQRVIRR